MTAYPNTSSLFAAGAITGSPRLLGLGPVFRKELREWLASRRVWMLLGVSSVMMVLNTLSANFAIAAATAKGIAVPPGLSMDPTINVLAKWEQWVFFFAIAFSVSLLIGERDRGTLAWSLSKPLSRTALIVGKWAAAMTVYVVFGLVLPMAMCVVAASVAYGTPDLGPIAVATVLLTATPAFFIALTLALGAILPSQAAVGGLAAIIAIAPGIVSSVSNDAAMLFPSSMGPWAVAYAMGAPVPASTPVGWLVGFVVVAVAGVVAMRRRDL